MSLDSENKNKAPVYDLRSVAFSVFVFYLVCFVFGARGLYHWTQKLPVSELGRTVGRLAESHWAHMAKFGFEEPSLALESFFLTLQDAHKLLYPKSYAELRQRREKKPQRAELAARIERELTQGGKAQPKAADLSVLVVGDSIMMSVGPVIRKDITQKLGGAAFVEAKLSTGLARPDVFDWIKELRRLTKEQQYDYVVMMFGTNDSQNFVERGEILSYGTEGWTKVYDERLNALMTAACEGGRRGIWLGLPPMQSAAFDRKAARINNLAKRQVETHNCMDYLPLDRVLGDENGRYVSYRKIDEHLQKVRMVDGVHVTAHGGVLISSALLEHLAPKGAQGSLLSH